MGNRKQNKFTLIELLISEKLLYILQRWRREW